MPDYSLLITLNEPRIRLRYLTIALEYMFKEAKTYEDIFSSTSKNKDSIICYISSGLSYNLFQEVIDKHLGKFKKMV